MGTGLATSAPPDRSLCVSRLPVRVAWGSDYRLDRIDRCGVRKSRTGEIRHMIHLIAFIACAFILAGAPSPSMAATYYVDDLDVNCAPASPGAGTLADPWKNLAYAGRRLACGDTLKVRKGTYRIDAQGFSDGACSTNNGEYSVLFFTQRCTASSPITVEPYNNE